MSSSIAEIAPEYRAVIVGSGYGGGIAARRLAEAGWSVCVLERGREIRPGEYPDTLGRAMAEVQIDHPTRHLFSPTALFDFRLNRDINVLVGCGLGGTSLINANVAVRPARWVFEDKRWPERFREDLTLLWRGFEEALDALRPRRYPPNAAPLLKLAALKQVAAALDVPFRRPPINVNFSETAPGAEGGHKACRLCGDCVSGCNYGAKRTVLTTYLEKAHVAGARIFTDVRVHSIEPGVDKTWTVHFDMADAGPRIRDAPRLSVRASVVILAAGTLGSTEILLRSRERHHLALSSRLGQHFTGNGDMIAVAYNCEAPIDGMGIGVRRPDPHDAVGPCISGMIAFRGKEVPREEEMVVEDGSIPGALGPIIPAVLGGAAALWGTPEPKGGATGIAGHVSRWGRYLAGAYHGATRRTQTFLVMAHDNAGGRMTLEDDRLRIDWQDASEQLVPPRVQERLARAAEVLKGTYVPNPFRPITVHPLGGCRMGDNPDCGVVDHKGRVFDVDRGRPYRGLYVCDGSVIPRSLGVNPLLTIAAVAERTCDFLLHPRP